MNDTAQEEAEHEAMIELAIAHLLEDGYIEALMNDDGEVVYRSIRPYRQAS